MADHSKYYYLKLKENFFDTEDMKLLESMDNGYIYSNILMKMYLLSLRSNGRLMYKDKIPYSPKMLSTILNHNVDILEKAIDIFKELGLIEVLNTGEMFMLDIQNYIGKSSDEADRKRLYRAEIEKKKLECKDICPDILRTNCSNIKDKDIIKDININKDIIINNNNLNNNTYNNIITYIENNYNRKLNNIELNEIKNLIDLLLFKKEDIENIFQLAVNIQVLNNNYKISYLKGILNNWQKENLITYDQINEYLNFYTEVEKEEKEEIFDYNWLED